MVMMIPKQSYSFDNIPVTLYLFFLVFFVIQTLASPTVHYCRHDQRDILLEFKHEFPVNESYSTSYIMSSWNKSSDCCFWEGVSCDASSGNVISLQFYHVFLNNTLKPNSGLFKLQYLQDLSLSSCNINGEIPSSLGNLSHLNSLDLSDNELVGQVPTTIGNLTELSSLNVGSNILTGNVPISFRNLKKLASLYLDNNFLENSISGPFPTSLLTNPLLQVVKIDGNQFNGSLEFLNTSSSLKFLNIAQNKFDGPIPESISKLLNLTLLDLSYNSFIGPIPRSISELVNLYYLDLSNNKLEGKVPSCLWRLTVLKLSQNSFSNFGKSSEVVVRAQMNVLSLDSNMFRGPFPHWICKFRSIDFLDLSNNSFSGSIPRHLRNITDLLQMLNLQNNNLSGILPDVFTNATNLQTLDVSRNHLEGKLPKSLMNCKAMQFINMESNNFKDEFPSWLGSLPSLNVLIDFSGNKFYGKIPDSIGLLKGLRLLNLSSNAFTSEIPKSLANLTNLEALDLSQNQPIGQIPQDLGILSFLSTMNFSHNHLEGPIPPGTQFQSQNCTSFMENPRLYGLEEICGKNHVLNPEPQEPEAFSEPEEEVINWIAAAIAYGPGVFCGLVIGHIFVSHKYEWLVETFHIINHKVVIRRGD